MSAENHAKIAEKVWPDARVFVHRCNVDCMTNDPDVTCIEFSDSRKTTFNLLETDSNGNPTQQAKASALDVLVWLNNECFLQSTAIEGKILMGHLLGCMTGDNPCAAIYKAACEVLSLE